jgi:hypothetical protein
VVGDGVAGFEPGLFESGLDAGFDFVGYVAVNKLALRYQATLHIAAINTWLRHI